MNPALLLTHGKRAVRSPAMLVLVAFALRMGVLFYIQSVSPTPRLDHMQFGYEAGRVARAIAAGEGFASPLRGDTGPTAWFAPVYPYLLAVVFKLFGIYTYRSYLVALTLNCAFSALTCFPVFYIGKKVFGVNVATCSGWLWAVLPSAVYFPIQWVWDTSLSALLLSLLFWATLCLPHHPGRWSWVGYGALWALSALTNPSLVSLLPFLLGWVTYQTRKQGERWHLLAGAASLAFLLAISPWLVRNYLTFGRFVFFRSNLGLELYLGNNEQVPDSWAWWLHPNDNDEEGEKFRRMGEIAYMAEKQREALHFMATHPWDVARFTYHRFIYNWTGISDSLADIWPKATWYYKPIYLINCSFSLLAFLGLLFLSRTRRAEALLFAAVLLVFPLVYYISHAALRYRHPIDPLMAVLMIYAVAAPWQLFTSRHKDLGRMHRATHAV